MHLKWPTEMRTPVQPIELAWIQLEKFVHYHPSDLPESNASSTGAAMLSFSVRTASSPGLLQGAGDLHAETESAMGLSVAY